MLESLSFCISHFRFELTEKCFVEGWTRTDYISTLNKHIDTLFGLHFSWSDQSLYWLFVVSLSRSESKFRTLSQSHWKFEIFSRETLSEHERSKFPLFDWIFSCLCACVHLLGTTSLLDQSSHFLFCHLQYLDCLQYDWIHPKWKHKKLCFHWIHHFVYLFHKNVIINSLTSKGWILEKIKTNYRHERENSFFIVKFFHKEL
jgi:hypothetical protein